MQISSLAEKAKELVEQTEWLEINTTLAHYPTGIDSDQFSFKLFRQRR